MGLLFSKEASPASFETAQPEIPASLPRKRPLSSLRQMSESFVPCETQTDFQKTNAIPNVDPTPDGDPHRYVVRCPAIFWCTRKDVSKMLDKLSPMPPYIGVQKIPKWDYFFISFPNAACAQLGVQTLSAHKYRNQQWRVEVSPQHTAKRRRFEKALTEPTLPSGDCLSAADVTAKWRNVSYDEQINRKKHKLQAALRAVTKHLSKEVKQVSQLPWLETHIANRAVKSHPMCCSLERILEADDCVEVRDYYRNKNEFTIGMSPGVCGMRHDYHEAHVSIGYSLGHMREGHFSVGPVDIACKTTSKLALSIADALTPVVERSNLPVYDKKLHKGYWRQLTVRESIRNDDFLVIVVVNSVDLKASNEEQTRLKDADRASQQVVLQVLQQLFEGQRRFGVYWHSSSQISVVSTDIPTTHLYGLRVLHEQMCGLTFRIQPTAFFQVNTAMAERLYSLIGDAAQVDSETVVLDVCCGTGTIGLSLARRAHKVVGIEMNQGAVEDARHNALLNNISNASFIVGRVETSIHEAIKQVDSLKPCIAILDPPRAGVPNNVIAAIRAMPTVRKVIYVACEPGNFWKNALALCRPTSKAFRLQPFKPVLAYGADLFPHTDHVEMVVVLERTDVEAGQ